MPSSTKSAAFFASEEGQAFIQSLKDMTADARYITNPGYSPNGELYPSHVIPFVEKHIEYLRTHPTTDPQHYLSNLRLITRVR
jgi:hypothetical protein